MNRFNPSYHRPKVTKRKFDRQIPNVMKCDLKLLEETSNGMFSKKPTFHSRSFNDSVNHSSVKTLKIANKQVKRIDYNHKSTPSIVISEEEDEDDIIDQTQSSSSTTTDNCLLQDEEVTFVKEISPGKTSSNLSQKENSRPIEDRNKNDIRTLLKPKLPEQKHCHSQTAFSCSNSSQRRGVSVITHTGLFDSDSEEEQQQSLNSSCKNNSSAQTKTWCTKTEQNKKNQTSPDSATSMSTSCTSPNSSPDSDDDIIIMGSQNDNATMSYSKLKSVITTICRNFVKNDELPVKDIDSKAVLQRLNSLYNRNFNTRLKEIRYIIENNKKRAILVNNSYEVCPGIFNTDIETLKDAEWLNDVIINRYMEIATKMWNRYIYFDSFLYEDIKRSYSPGLQINWSAIEAALIPVCLSSHWMLLCFRPKASKMQLYNSMTVSVEEMECAKTLATYFGAITTGSNVSIQVIEEAPRQENAYDCGVYTCMFARCVVYGNSLQFHPNQVRGYRDWMKQEILAGEMKMSLS